MGVLSYRCRPRQSAKSTMASFLVARCFPQTLRGKFLQALALLVISLLLINWYFLGEGGLWKNKVTLEKKDTGMRDVVDKDIQILERMSFLESPLTPLKSRNVVCPNLSLEYTNNADYGLCTPHKPSEYSCDFARKNYFIDPELSKCKKKGFGDVCKIEVSKTRKRKAIKFVCNKALCKQGESGSFKVHSINPTTGLTEIVKAFSTVEKLERELPAIARRNKENKFNFVFIECTNHQGKEVTQFLPLEPSFTIEETKNIRNRNLINVNVLLIDSLSRAHFYRSLPRTVSTFKKWRENPRAVPAKVYDFELFQAVHGHTVVNMHAFYTGELLPIEQKDKTLPVNISALFGQYKRAGFQTVWQEDLCWEGTWGLMTDLGAEDWEGLQAKVKSTYIGHTGTLINSSLIC